MPYYRRGTPVEILAPRVSARDDQDLPSRTGLPVRLRDVEYLETGSKQSTEPLPGGPGTDSQSGDSIALYIDPNHGETKRMEEDTNPGRCGPMEVSKAAKARFSRNHHGMTCMSLPSAPAATTDLPLCELGAVELLTFFPNHTLWPLVSLRLHSRGWSVAEIAAVALHARGTLTTANLYTRRAALRHQIRANGRELFGNNFTLTRWKDGGYRGAPVGCHTTSYRPRAYIESSELKDESLVACAQGVIDWPAGQDRGIFTQCVEHACSTRNIRLMISDVPSITDYFGFEMPVEATGGQWDQNAAIRVHDTLEGRSSYQ